MFMMSSGGLTAAELFQGKDAILSGPAGGVVGMAQTGHEAGFSRLIGFDMGGTSTDVSHYDGEYERAFETEVAGVTTNLPFLRWLVAHPIVRAGEATTAFLTEHPPLSEPPLRLPDAPWRGGWRLNLPPAPPAPAPDVDSAAHDRAAGPGSGNVTAPMPGTVIGVKVAPGY